MTTTATTLEIRPLSPRAIALDRTLLCWHLLGFVGLLWLDIPFATAEQAMAYCQERGWPCTVRS